MRIRAILASVICNVTAFFLLSMGAFLFIHFTKSGHFAVDMSKASPGASVVTSKPAIGGRVKTGQWEAVRD